MEKISRPGVRVMDFTCCSRRSKKYRDPQRGVPLHFQREINIATLNVECQYIFSGKNGVNVIDFEKLWFNHNLLKYFAIYIACSFFYYVNYSLTRIAPDA